MDDKRRCKVFRVSSHMLMELFRDGARWSYRVVADGLPDDATVVACDFNALDRPGIAAFLIRSETFDSVAEGQPWPEIEPKMESFP